MLLHVDDVTPGSQRFVWIPHTTFDLLIRQNALSVTVLQWYFRHTEKYDPTLTKLLAVAEGQGKTHVTRANDVLYENRFLIRFEFGISIPTGEKGRPGQRYSRICASRVRISDEQLADLVRQHTPGKYVVIPWGAEPQPGEPAEQRRVRIISCEVYVDGIARKITACVCPDHSDRTECDAAECPNPHGEPLLADHQGRKGKRAERTARTPPKWPPKPPTSGPVDNSDSEVAPEVEKLTSGATCENRASPHVPPEVDQPKFGQSDSIKKINQQTQENDQARGAASGADPAALRLAGPEESAAASVGGPPPPACDGDHQTARARDANAGGLRWHGVGALSLRTDAAAQHELNRVKTSGRHPGPTWDQQKGQRAARDPQTRAAVRAELDEQRRQGPRRAPIPTPPAAHASGGVSGPGATPPASQSRSRA